MSMLELRHINKTFFPGTPNERAAVSDLSLSLEKGDFVTVIGSNGAGKSTVFNLISGVLIPDSGSVLLDGEDITDMEEHKRSKMIGRLFQNPMLGTAPDMTIEENLYLAGGNDGWFGRITRAKKDEFRQRLSVLGMGLEDRMRMPVGFLSGGQRQALTLMMATFNSPKLLLLDEHTAALDPATAEKVLEITADVVRENGITCMMITHNMQSALDMGSRTVMMRSGRIVTDVSGEERQHMTVDDLLRKFRENTGEALVNDRMLM